MLKGRGGIGKFEVAAAGRDRRPFDPAEMVPMPAGSFATHFAKQVHWDGAKDEEAWVLIVGEVPAISTRVEEAK